jgi:flagellar hook-associated protein FlgK
VNILSIAQSGMQSAQLRLDSSANNVANLPTQGYRRQEAVAEAQPEGGVATRLQKAQQPGVNLEEEVVEQMSASFAYKANLQVLRVADRNMGALLNEKA